MSDGPRRSDKRLGFRRLVPVVLGVAGFVLAMAIVWGKRDEVLRAGDDITRVRLTWVGVGVGAEAAAVVAFAQLQRVLLRAGEVNAGLARLTGVTLAGNALQNSLPGGGAWASVYAFRQFRRLGADEVLAGWMLLAISGLSAVALALVAAGGVAMAEADAASFDLIETIGVVVVLAGALVITARRGTSGRIVAWSLRWSQRLVGRPRGDIDAIIASATDRLEAVAPSKRRWLGGLSAALGNWIFDCACLAACFAAVHSDVPWRGLLLAYGAAQLAANLPITPGGLGVVEGSLTIALVAYGGGRTSTVAAVLLYRLVSFWALIAIGWLTLATTSVMARRAAAGADSAAVQPEAA